MKERILKNIAEIQVSGKSTIELYNEISSAVMREISFTAPATDKKSAYYLSIEFLIGRMFYNNLLELDILHETEEILKAKGADISLFEMIEDAALGNGGLGRLAACFVDSAAGLNLPAYGRGIRYKYGLFKQKFEDGFQEELPDDWQSFGDPWGVRRESEARIVKFADGEVRAVPYDVPIIGKERINALRLYQAEGDEKAEKISEYLYPADDTEEGKLLRLRQEYFLSAAAVGELIDAYVALHGTDFSSFPVYNAIQLNDTHPVLSVAEFVRILTSTYSVSFSKAVSIAKQVFNYTNHTILPEALECWPQDYIRKLLPEIYTILKKFDAAEHREFRRNGVSKADEEAMSILRNDTFSMANLAVYVAHRVNGVAKIHTGILKDSLFRPAYAFAPEKFVNITNGITQRRWLQLCNEEFSALIDRKIGCGWRENIGLLSELKKFGNEDSVIAEFAQIKEKKKEQLADYVYRKEKIRLLPGGIVYAQVKRLHEYKRQLMTAFAILEIYEKLKKGDLEDFRPAVFLFGAKSAPSYFRAKGIIKFINEIAKKIAADDRVNKKLQVVFVTDYNVSYAEKIVAGSDVSLQVSTAGLEASGTGNMKFMMNGAVTCGTMDGANIEIVEQAGRENNYIFGADVEEIKALSRGKYDPNAILKSDDAARNAVNTLTDGTFDDGGRGYFKELYDSLTVGASWHKPDHYFILRDLPDYVEALLRINKEAGTKEFTQKQFINAASSAYFSSDRSIREYAEKIWEL